MALDPNINRIKFHRTKVAGREPTTANVSEGELALNLTDKTIYTNDGTQIVRIGDPDKLPRYEVLGTNSAILRNAAGLYAQSGTGALVISLPKAKFNSTTMLKIRVDGYNYSQEGSWSLELAGYNYTNSVWHNCMANLTSGGSTTPFIRNLSNNEAQYSVKFGASADRNIIVIGNATTTWQYPNIQISEVLLGYTNSTNGGWDSDWKLEFVNSQTVLDSYTYVTGQGQPQLHGINKVLTANTLFTPRTINGVSFDGSANITVYDATKLPLTGGTITGTLQVNGSFTANTNIQNTTGNNLSFLNGGAALGINVGNILISNSYSDVSRVPTNGAFIKGGLEADAIITGKVPTAYTTVQSIGVAGGSVYRSKDVNIGSTYGFTPILSWNVQSNEGYRQVNHIGGYRPNANWTDAGVYIAPGGGNDGYASEAFLFQFGRKIANTAGPVLVKGIADYANNIDASTGSLYGTAAIGWRKLGIATIPQAGRTLKLDLFGGTGFNSPNNPQQAMPMTMVLKSGNGSPKSLNMVVHAHDGQNLLGNLGAGVANACYVPIGTADDYEVWIYSVGYLTASLVASAGALTTWTQDFTSVPVAAKPSGAIDARIFTVPNTATSNVASADKLSTARLINGVAFDGTSNINVQPVSFIIPGNVNLNDYQTEGFYYCPLNATADTIANSPLASTAFSLLVEKSAGVKQTWTAYLPNQSRTFVRNIYNSSQIGAWREIAFTDNTVLTGVTKATRIESVELYTTGGINNQGSFTSGNQTELGSIGTNTQAYIDFHSGPATNDYDTRIISSGGATAAGNGALSYIAATHTFNGVMTADAVGVSRFGILNNVSTNQLGISLYGGASSGKPSYGFMFSGTANAGCGTHGDVNGQWSVYLTCATAGAEKRGWIFQRSDSGSNVASISTNGVLTTNGSINTTGDNTMINVGNNNDLALVKKAGGSAFVGVGLNTAFRVLKSPNAAVDPSYSYTELFSVASNGDFVSSSGVFKNDAYHYINYGKAGNDVFILGSYDGTVRVHKTMSDIYTTVISENRIEFPTSGEATLKGSGPNYIYVNSGAWGCWGADGVVPLGVANGGTGNTAGIAPSATKLQTARLIGGVSFDGTANINLPGVNIAGNQNTSGNAATATTLQTGRTFSITGAATAAGIAFNGSQNVALNVTSLDGTKVTGKVPNAVNADVAARATSVDINGQPGKSLKAVWIGATFGNYSRNFIARDANTYEVLLDNDSGIISEVGTKVKVGDTIHLTVANWAKYVTGTITSATFDPAYQSLRLLVNVPNHGTAVGQTAGYYLLAITYYSRYCTYIGTVATETGSDNNSGYSHLIRTDMNINIPIVEATASSMRPWYSNVKGYAFLDPAQPVGIGATMIQSNLCNFITSDTDSPTFAKSGYVCIQMWDMT